MSSLSWAAGYWAAALLAGPLPIIINLTRGRPMRRLSGRLYVEL